MLKIRIDQCLRIWREELGEEHFETVFSWQVLERRRGEASVPNQKEQQSRPQRRRGARLDGRCEMATGGYFLFSILPSFIIFGLSCGNC